MNNTEIVQEGYEKFGNGDIEGLLNLFSEDIKWTTPQTQGSPIGGTYNGRSEVGEFFRLLADSEDITHFEPTEFIADGDKVVVLGNSTATVRETNRSYDNDWVHIFTVEDGKITGFLEFFDTAKVERAFQKAETV